MYDKWKLNPFTDCCKVWWWLLVALFFHDLGFCWPLNDEGLALLRLREAVVRDPSGALANWRADDGNVDPCSWFGVECSHGEVIALNIKDLCLEGTLVPELKNLVRIKFIIIRNNSFTGRIPEGIGELKDLEVLDLWYNNFSGPLPLDLCIDLTKRKLLLGGNPHLDSECSENREFLLLSRLQNDENQLSKPSERLSCDERSVSERQCQLTTAPHLSQSRSLVQAQAGNSSSPHSPFSKSRKSPAGKNSTKLPDTDAPPPSFFPPTPPSFSPESPASPPSSSPPPSVPSQNLSPSGKKSYWQQHEAAILAGSIGSVTVLLIALIGLYLFSSNKFATVKPWVTGLSGQLQKAFVTGVPKLKRSELEVACEDFSNVIGSLPIGTLYKGTLSSGVEIAVATFAAKSANDWSRSMEMQFRKKVETLSKVTHKNFVNLLGFCQEEEPFFRAIVFEYAPNGTLFERLHAQEAEHLDWRMRLRIAMGMAYCLEHMHRLNPPIVHYNLTSSSVYLTEDYAAKVAEFSFCRDINASEPESSERILLSKSSGGLESNVYSFGVMLLEMMTGRSHGLTNNGELAEWASDYLRGEQPIEDMVDPTLNSFQEGQLAQIGEVIKSCLHPARNKRPGMSEVNLRLRAITGIMPEEAYPKLSPEWWTELESVAIDSR